MWLKDWMEIVEYRITEGSDYGWQCYGPNVHMLDSWNGEQDGHSFSVIFDTKNQTVYEVQAHDYTNQRAYRWINPGETLVSSTVLPFSRVALGAIGSLHLVGSLNGTLPPEARLSLKVVWGGEVFASADVNPAALAEGLDLPMERMSPRGTEAPLELELRLSEAAVPLNLSVTAIPM